MDNNKTAESGLKEKLSNLISHLKPARGASLTTKKARSGWLFVLPFIIGLLLLYIPIIYESLSYSFALYTPIAAAKGGGYSLTFVWFENYAEVITKTVDTTEGTTFIEMLFTGFFQQVVEIFAIIMLSLFVAIMLNSKMVGRAAFRAIFFIPVIIGTGIIAKIDTGNVIIESMGSLEGIDMGSVETGGLNNLVSAMDISMMFQNLGFGSQLVTVVTDLVGNIYNIVNRSGVQMLIFLAALQSISPSIYESCQMEGATGWETFWKITIPMISPMILANSLYTVIDSFTATTNKVMNYIINYSDALTPNPEQSAMAWIYFAVVAVALGLVALLCRTFIFYQRRND